MWAPRFVILPADVRIRADLTLADSLGGAESLTPVHRRLSGR
jgi:hypothetical protein